MNLLTIHRNKIVSRNQCSRFDSKNESQFYESISKSHQDFEKNLNNAKNFHNRVRTDCICNDTPEVTRQKVKTILLDRR